FVRSSSMSFPPGRFSAKFQTVDRMILYAFRLKTYQLVGQLPNWVTSERYDIDAKAEGTPTRDEIRLMMQRMLAERFQLKTHRETRDLPVYALVAAKGTP